MKQKSFKNCNTVCIHLYILAFYSVSLQPILTKSDILTVCGSPRLHNFMQHSRITYIKKIQLIIVYLYPYCCFIQHLLLTKNWYKMCKALKTKYCLLWTTIWFALTSSFNICFVLPDRLFHCDIFTHSEKLLYKMKSYWEIT